MALVRLRPRSRRSPDRSGPSATFDASTFEAWTTVGNLGSRGLAMVDPSGRIAVDGAGWLLDWWIGAEDRWHRPASEAAVRQELVGASPVVETRVKVPSGDAVARAYGARGLAGEDLVVLDVENASKVPVALALVVRSTAGGSIRSLQLDGSTLLVDDVPTLHLARSPGRIAMSTAADPVDAGDVVLAGDAEPVRARHVRCADGDAQAALLFPLAHTATLRVAISLEDVARPVDPTALPSATQVASGWATHARSGARIEVPDRRLRDAVKASTRFLHLASDDRDAALALEHLGLPSEAERAWRGGIRGQQEAGTMLAWHAARWRFTRTLPAEDALWLAGLVHHWARSTRPADAALGHAALPAIAEVLEAMGETAGAEDVRRIHREHRAPTAERDDPYELLASASPTFTWRTERAGHDLAVNAALVLAVRHLLVDDAGDGLVLSPVTPDAWLGQGWEVHDLPAAHGRLSFAIRWHGERPALLWELEPHEGEPPVELTCGLDPTWSSRAAAGEALLAPVAVPERPSQRRGLTIPVTIEPVRRRA
jgi:hypothetical protein